MPTIQAAHLKALFAVTAWGTSFIAIKFVLREVSPVTVVWLRFALGIIVLGTIVFQRRQFAWPKARETPLFILLGGLGITFHQWLLSNGLVTAAASTTGWIIAIGPIFIALFGWLFLKERLGWLRVGGIALASFGVLLVISNGNLAAILQGSFGVPGDWLILISTVNWSVFSIISRSALARHPAARMMFFVMLIGWLFSGLQYFSGAYFLEIKALTFIGWLNLIFLGVLCTGLAYTAWYDALKDLPAAQVGVFLYFQPLVAVAAAALLLGEAITMASLGGGAVILLGVWLVNQKIVLKNTNSV